MKAQAFFVPFPKAGDKYWQKQVPVAMRNDYIRLGNLYQKKPWNAIPAETFAEFRTNGNRTRYEEASFGIRKQFVCLVMAEIMQGRGRFLPSIRKGLHYFIEKEPWWGIPAHYPKDHPERISSRWISSMQRRQACLHGPSICWKMKSTGRKRDFAIR